MVIQNKKTMTGWVCFILLTFATPLIAKEFYNLNMLLLLFLLNSIAAYFVLSQARLKIWHIFLLVIGLIYSQLPFMKILFAFTTWSFGGFAP